MKINKVSKVKNSNAMKSIPIKSNKKTVALGGIAIFFSDSVGTLLTSKKATKTVR